MTLPDFKIGLPVQSASDPASVAESGRASWTTLFDGRSTVPTSHIVTAAHSGLLLQAFGLESNEALNVQMVVGTHEGDKFENIMIRAQPLALSWDNNVLFIPFPGRFRLSYSGDRLGSIYAYASPAPYGTLQAVRPDLV